MPGFPIREDLGKQSLAGLDTVGTRETTVIEAGAIGNDNPIQTTLEYWYSRELGVNLISKRHDPRFGTQNFELSNIVLGEPDAGLFEVPSGSTIIDLRGSTQTTPPGASSPQ